MLVKAAYKVDSSSDRFKIIFIYTNDKGAQTVEEFFPGRIISAASVKAHAIDYINTKNNLETIGKVLPGGDIDLTPDVPIVTPPTDFQIWSGKANKYSFFKNLMDLGLIPTDSKAMINLANDILATWDESYVS